MNEISKKRAQYDFTLLLNLGITPPIFGALLNQVSSFSVLSHRIIWSGIWMFFLVIITGRQQLYASISTIYAPTLLN